MTHLTSFFSRSNVPTRKETQFISTTMGKKTSCTLTWCRKTITDLEARVTAALTKHTRGARGAPYRSFALTHQWIL